MSVPRFFLVHLQQESVAAVEAGDASALAALAARHQRAAAVSERVIDDVRKRPQARDNPRFAFAAGNLPYLVAAPDPHGIAEAIATIEGLESEAKLEAFFTAQAERLGLAVRKLDRSLVPPTEAALAAWLQPRLEGIAAAAAPKGFFRAFRRAPDEEAKRLGARALAEALGRIGPVWSEGRGRWLGLLAGPAPAPAHDAALLAPYEVDPVEVRGLLGAPDPQAPVLAALRGLLRRDPAIGGAGAGEEAVLLAPTAAEGIARLLGERWEELRPQAVRFFLSDELDDWRRLLLAALHVAHGRGASLLEARDVFRYGYRWPPLP